MSSRPLRNRKDKRTQRSASGNELHRRWMEAWQRERRELALQLHETLSQTLASCCFVTANLLRRSAEQEVRTKLLADLDRNMDLAVEQTRALARELGPSSDPAGPGLMLALEELSLEMGASSPCRFLCEEPVIVQDRIQAVAFYHFARAASQAFLQSPGRHRVQIALTEDNRTRTLEVWDNIPRHAVVGQDRIEELSLYAEAAGGRVTMNRDWAGRARLRLMVETLEGSATISHDV